MPEPRSCLRRALRRQTPGATTASFTFEYIADYSTGSATAMVTINVAGVNDPPTLLDLQNPLIAKPVLPERFWLEATDPDGDAVAISIAAQPEIGMLTMVGLGSGNSQQIEYAFTGDENIGQTVMLSFELDDSTSTVAAQVPIRLEPFWQINPHQARYRLEVLEPAPSMDETELPVLVQLSTSTVDYNRIHPSGDDIRFFDAEDNPLPYEIETFNPGGNSFIWVRLKTVRASGSNDIWMYVDAPSVPPPTNQTDVWSEYEGVWHLNGNMQNAADSGGVPAWDATQGSTPLVDGRFGGGRDFSTTGSFADLLTTIPVDMTGALTLWFMTNSQFMSGEYGVLFYGTMNNIGDGTGMDDFFLGVTNGLRLHLKIDDDFDMTHTSTNGNGWHLAMATWSEDTDVAFLANDYGPIETLPFMSGFPNLEDSNGMVRLGSTPDPAAPQYFQGQLDEIRISDSLRSTDWLRFERSGMTGQLFRWYPLEEFLP